MKTFHKTVLAIVVVAFITIFTLKTVGADPTAAGAKQSCQVYTVTP